MDEDRHNWSACYDTTNNKYVFVWRSAGGGSQSLYYRVGTAGSSSISWSAATQIESAAIQCPQIRFDSGTGRLICFYRLSSDWYPRAVIGSYNSSNGLIDWGTKTTVSSTAAASPDLRICKASSTTGKYALFWRKNSDNTIRSNLITISSSANSFTNDGEAAIASISWQYFECAYDANADRIIMIGRHNSQNSPYVQRVKVKSGNDGLEADGSEVQADTTDPSKDMAIEYSAAAQRVYIWWRNPSNSHRQAYNWIANTTGTITLGTETDIGEASLTSNNAVGVATIHPASGVIIKCNSYRPDTRAYMLAIKTTTNTSNQYEAGKRFIGFAPSAISDGATGTVNTDGNTIANQSGLTIGTRYYVQDNGTLGTGTTNGSGVTYRGGGLALSASKILIRYKHE